MKKVLLAATAIIAGCAFCSPGLSAQDNDLSLKRIMDDAVGHITRIERDFKISKLEIDLVFQSSPRQTSVKLVGGRRYEILAVGERNRVGDLDLKIFDKDSNLLKNIPNSTNQVQTDFTPSASGTYTFEFTASDFFSGYTAARYMLIVAFP